MAVAELKAPFPYFGGKSRIAGAVWERLGDVENYVEPFFGSGAVLLGRPGGPGKIETVNDADGLVANFWRAVQGDPDGVAAAVDWPVNEVDQYARHCWLIEAKEGLKEKLEADPEFYDVKIAGWWCWGACIWIGTGWCQTAWRKLPHLGDAGKGVHRDAPMREWMAALAGRLRRVRVACGDWSRVTGPSVTFRHGLTGVFLDPPYLGDRNQAYSEDEAGVGEKAAAWAIEQGENPLMRIAYCGYAGTVEFPETWTEVPWKAHGGYGSLANGSGRENSARERVWFSPHCLQTELF